MFLKKVIKIWQILRLGDFFKVWDLIRWLKLCMNFIFQKWTLHISDCIYILHIDNILKQQNKSCFSPKQFQNGILNFDSLFAGWDSIQLQRFVESHTVSVWSRFQAPGCLYLPGPDDNRWPKIDERRHNNRHGKATFQKIHGCVHVGRIWQSDYCALWCACCAQTQSDLVSKRNPPQWNAQSKV